MSVVALKEFLKDFTPRNHRKVTPVTLPKTQLLPLKPAPTVGGNEGNVKNDSNEKDLINILGGYGLTKDSIMRGLSLWKQPFDEEDLQDIKQGIITLDNVRDYLALWIVQKNEMYLELKRGASKCAFKK
ncbi:hypothetical protein [Alkalimarinus alittae]|uniref:RxLR effector protein n=1 Tax=Alkalimarinus alittae TaxID=2961619 RepID=A0ABY6N4Q6_9ALTE|nr:hypothetical protein [Alkalimarinus alittae]UZE96949.1 hypothetical protein NKI27_04135 [Alkalimarinus alittae]